MHAFRYGMFLASVDCGHLPPQTSSISACTLLITSPCAVRTSIKLSNVDSVVSMAPSSSPPPIKASWLSVKAIFSSEARRRRMLANSVSKVWPLSKRSLAASRVRK